MKNYTKEELEGLTLKGREGEKGLHEIADSLEVAKAPKADLIKAILKAQIAAEKETAEKAAEKEAAKEAEKPAAKAAPKKKAAKAAAAETSWTNPPAQSRRGAELEKVRSDKPADELTNEEFPRVDEEKTAANRFVKEDAKLEKFVNDGLLPDRVNTRAAVQQVAPVEIARQVAEGWNAPVEKREREAEQL